MQTTDANQNPRKPVFHVWYKEVASIHVIAESAEQATEFARRMDLDDFNTDEFDWSVEEIKDTSIDRLDLWDATRT